MPRFFIARPIFAWVIALMIMLAGLLSVKMLPVSQYQAIAPPQISINANYPGASAKEVADAVAAPIEQQVNGVEGIMYMSSQCANDGSYGLTVTFQPGINLDVFLPVEIEKGERGFEKITDSVRFSGGDDEVVRLLLLEHERHAVDGVGDIAPLDDGVGTRAALPL